MNKIEIHKSICEKLSKTYELKNADYGDGYSRIRKRHKDSYVIRLLDKVYRLESLEQKEKPNFESIEDSLLDLANYAIMEVVEMRADREREVKESAKDMGVSLGSNSKQPTEKKPKDINEFNAQMGKILDDIFQRVEEMDAKDKARAIKRLERYRIMNGINLPLIGYYKNALGNNDFSDGERIEFYGINPYGVLYKNAVGKIAVVSPKEISFYDKRFI